MSQFDNQITATPGSKLVKDSLNIVAIIPAYNEENNIGKIVDEVKKYVTSIVVVDDGSTDSTFERAIVTGVKVLRNNKNRGKGAALRRGLLESFKLLPDIIITLDADGQHLPSDIPKLVKPIKENEADMVIGSRYHSNAKSEIPLTRGMGLSIINKLNKSLINSEIKDSQSGFRAYNKLMFTLVTDYESSGYGAETEQLAQAETYGINITEVPITIKYKGLKSTSKQNPFKHGVHLVSTILKISVEKRPLLFFGLSGMILIALALVPLTNLLLIFNETRYFSIPLSIVALGLVFIGSLLVVISFVLYVLNRLRQKINRLLRE